MARPRSSIARICSLVNSLVSMKSLGIAIARPLRRPPSWRRLCYAGHLARPASFRDFIFGRACAIGEFIRVDMPLGELNRLQLRLRTVIPPASDDPIPSPTESRGTVRRIRERLPERSTPRTANLGRGARDHFLMHVLPLTGPFQPHKRINPNKPQVEEPQVGRLNLLFPVWVVCILAKIWEGLSMNSLFFFYTIAMLTCASSLPCSRLPRWRQRAGGCSSLAPVLRLLRDRADRDLLPHEYISQNQPFPMDEYYAISMPVLRTAVSIISMRSFGFSSSTCSTSTPSVCSHGRSSCSQ